jgi:hypothetical protein
LAWMAPPSAPWPRRDTPDDWHACHGTNDSPRAYTPKGILRISGDRPGCYEGKVAVRVGAGCPCWAGISGAHAMKLAFEKYFQWTARHGYGSLH